MTDAHELEPAALTIDEIERIILKTEPPYMSDNGDRIWTRRMAVALADRFNALLAARSAPEAGKAAVKPLDLSNLLRHAFMFGFETMGGTAEAAKDWWPVYNPEECPAFERILSALASSPAPTGAEPVAWQRKRDGHLINEPRQGYEPLYASPQPVAPTGEIAGLRRMSDAHREHAQSAVEHNATLNRLLSIAEARADRLEAKLEEHQDAEDKAAREMATVIQGLRNRATAAERKLEEARKALHSCVCLLETMAEAAKERGDDAEWAMMSVMAKNGRETLNGYHPE